MPAKSPLQWVLVQEISHPDEAQLIGGLLQMAAIPVRIERDTAAELYGLTIGPLAVIRIYVPSTFQAEAEWIISGDYPVPEEPNRE